MTPASGPVEGAPEPSETLPALGHLRCLVTPALACIYVGVAPRGWGWALGFATLPFLLDVLASRSSDDTRQPSSSASRGAFDALVVALFVLHWATLALAGRLFTQIDALSCEAATAVLLLALSTSLLAGALGHELIHRRSALAKGAGRLLLASMFYEHLFTEHLRGHHARAGTPADPTTARLNESLVAYLLRATPGQLVSAWQLERARLQGRSWLVRLVANRVLQGIGLELGFLGGAWLLFGPAGTGALALSGLIANLLFQIVNYFQHWGVTRDTNDPAGLAWDSSNRSTLFSMVGLALHGDHHQHPARPFQELRHLDESNALPGGYGQTIWLAVFRNRRFRELMTAELERRGRLPAGYAPADANAPLSAHTT